MLGFPITNTLMGLGGYPASDRQYLGMPGMHGTYKPTCRCSTPTCWSRSAPASTIA